MCTCNPSSSSTSGERGVTKIFQPVGQESSIILKRSHRKFRNSSCSLTSPVCVGMAWRRLITASAMRQLVVVAVAGDGQSRGGALGSLCPGGVEHVGLRASALHDTKQLAHYHGLLQCVQRHQQDDDCACKGGNRRAGAHAACRQVLR